MWGKKEETMQDRGETKREKWNKRGEGGGISMRSAMFVCELKEAGEVSRNVKNSSRETSFFGEIVCIYKYRYV